MMQSSENRAFAFSDSRISRRHWLAGVTGVVLTPWIAGAQDRLTVKPATAARVTAPPQTLREVQAASQQLLSQSRDSFERGLMPLTDHLDQLTTALNLNLRLFGASGQRDVQRAAQVQHVRQLESVAAQLDQFQQPASIGWQSDVLLARYSLAEAQVQLARFDSQPERAAVLQAQAVEFARQHWAKRLDDSSIGHASAMQLWRATSLMNSSERQPLAVDRAILRQTMESVDRWNFVGAGIGRSDLREALQYEMTRLDLLDAKPGSDAFSAATQKAESQLLRLYQTLTQLQAQGTASLYDVATTWRERSELHAYLSSAGGDSVPKAWRQRRNSDLQSLQRLSANATDRRGRLAADTTYVELLTLSERTSEIR